MNTNKSNPVGTSINKKFTAFFLIESNKKTNNVIYKVETSKKRWM